MVWEIVFPISAHALTGGPSQPEVQSFEPIGTSDMVDPFSGDFNYNIPLLDIEGYPVNISYHSGITADQEASWTGLGWNINAGSITRNMRGLPDDFNGDTVEKKFYLKPDRTIGANLGVKFEFLGLGKIGGSKLDLGLGYNFGMFHNTYRGVGYEYGFAPSLSLGDKVKGNLNLNIGYNSQSGLNFNTSLGMSAAQENAKENVNMGLAGSVSAGYNSREGLKTLSFGTHASVQQVGNFKKSGDAFNGKFSDDRSTSVSFASPSYSPAISMPMVNTGVVLAGSMGLEILGLHPGVSFTGYYTQSQLAAMSVKRNAFGYLNLQNAKSDSALTDYNREKDGGFTREMARLAVPQLTFDMYNVSGHGVGGTFRPYRSEVGVIGDDRNTNLSTNTNIGLEVGFLNVLHAGADLRWTRVNTTGGKWNGLGGMKFAPSGGSSYEGAYFKNAAEVVKGNTTVYERVGKDAPVRLKISAGGGNIYSTGTLLDYQNKSVKLSSKSSKNAPSGRQVRNAAMSYVMGSEKYAALDTAIRYFDINQNPDIDGKLIAPSGNKISRNKDYRKGHHISEVTVNNPDGSRYVYGIPAYNNTTREITFGINGSAAKNCATGHVKYDKDGSGAIIAGGSSLLYNETKTPSYAHSYLLTGVLSDDYTDLTNNGISNDDMGTAVKFNYSRAQSNYKWRIPYKQDSAAFNAGKYSDVYDDKASIVYGEKEMWYLHSIETKNYVALFKISTREDGLGTLGVHGGKDAGARMYKLDSIVLYAKFNGKISTTPIKTVKFVYDYSLCQGIDNANGTNGKLTLKEVVFLYGTSKKGYRNKYKFTYQNNYKYQLKSYDRWGSYLKYGVSSGCTKDSVFPSEAPYTPQNKTIADQYASAWTLKTIDLPSGGRIDVTYEADDYAFVQDKKAMQMFTIAGFGSSQTFSSSNELYDPAGKPKEYIFFKLQNPAADNSSSMNNLHHYLKDMEWLYYNAFVRLKDQSYDYIRGYLKPTNVYGISSNPAYGYIKINTVKIDESSDRQVNPITKSALQFMRLEVPYLVFPASAPDAGGTESDIKGVMGAYEEGKIMLKGFNQYCIDNFNAAKTCQLNKSFIRLFSPYGMKKGGGSRVKRIEFSDNWEAMSGRTGTNHITQGLEYDYTLPAEESGANADGTLKSSGVASWEPEIGGDENPFRKPVFYTVKTKMGQDNELFQEEPYGESMMPAPVVGYSYVTIKQIAPSGVGIRGTGFTRHEFYTAKHYPAKIRSTQMDKLDNVNTPGNHVRRFLGMSVKEYVGVSQGYAIELNDMHGKPKAKYTYRVGANHKAEIISGVYYEYVNKPGTVDELSNTVKVIKPDGQVESKDLGVEMDMTVDMREQITDNNCMTMGIGIDNTVLGFIPLIVPHAWPMPVNETSTFKSSVMAKVIRRNGILKRTVALKEGSAINTDNVAWDSETGETLLSSSTNEFGDTLYSMKYPAHWYYGGMGQAYKNVGARANGSGLPFKDGDEVWVANPDGSSPQKGWYYAGSVKNISGSNIGLGGKRVMIYRSGYRNKPSETIYQVSSLKTPLASGQTVWPKLTTGVIDAKGVEFSDNWKGGCEKVSGMFCIEVTDTGKQFYNLFKWLHQNNQLCKTQGSTFTLYDPANPSASPSWYPSSYIFSKVQDGWAGSYKHIIKWDIVSATSIKFLFMLDPAPTTPYFGAFNANISGFGSNYTCDSITRFAGIKESHMNAQSEATLYTYNDSTLHCLNLTVDGFYLSRCPNLNLYSIPGANDYASGKLGNYRKKRDFYFPTTRKQSSPVKVRTDGTWETFSPLYSFFDVSSSTYWGELVKNTNGWNSQSEVTNYAHNGQEIENKDALGNYSSALFGFNKTLPVAVTKNSRYLQMGVVSCDADVDYNLVDGAKSYWRFLKTNNALPTYNSSKSHTGNRCIELTAGDSAQSVVRTYPDQNYETNTSLYQPFCNGEFYPLEGKYIISAWVKVDTTANADHYSRPYIKVFSRDEQSIKKLYADGPIVEGWQRISGEVDFSLCPSPYFVRLIADPSFKTYYDDIRVHPKDALMMSYVYDPVTLRLMSTLDENNYATYYEYDEEGNLVRTKRETERGVMTISESRQSIRKPGN